MQKIYINSNKNCVRIVIALMLMIGVASVAKAQDPHFTQYNAAPILLNPAYTGVFTGKTRFMTNFRQQWTGGVNPYQTSMISADTKINYDGDEIMENVFSAGVNFLSDKSLQGTLKSNYFSLSAAYHVNSMDWEGLHKFGLGLMATYGDRNINFSSLTFESQFQGSKFNTALPTGETALKNMKPFLSLGAGLLYRYNNEETGVFLDLGASAYNINKPSQTVLDDPNQKLPMRMVVQADVQKIFIEQGFILDIRAIYQTQAAVQYFIVGAGIAKQFGSDFENDLGLGLMLRTKDAIAPYVQLRMNKFRIGLSYDITTSSLKTEANASKSLELSLRYSID